MKIILAILLSSTLAINYNNRAVANKNLPTFEEALFKASHPPGAQSKVLENEKFIKDQEHVISKDKNGILEVIRINEKVIVDKDNKPKAFVGNIHNTVFAVESGKLTRLFEREIVVVPNPKDGNLANAQTFLQKRKGLGERIKEFFSKFGEKLHLDRKGPALIAATLLGFISTGIIYMIAYLMITLIYFLTGYDALDGKDDEIDNDKILRSAPLTENDYLLDNELSRVNNNNN